MGEKAPTIIRPTPERMAQGGIIPVPENRGERPKPWQAFESIHDEFLAGAKISRQAWEAANVFQRNYLEAIGPDVKAQSYTRVDNSMDRFDGTENLAAVIAVKRWSRDLAPDLFGILASCLGHQVSPSRWARDNDEHPAAGRVLLIAAMEQFARLR